MTPVIAPEKLTQDGKEDTKEKYNEIRYSNKVSKVSKGSKVSTASKAAKGRNVKIGVIAAAGKGTRAYPRTSFIPKPLFRFGEKSMLELNAEIQFKEFKVERLIVLVGYLKEQVIEEVERIRAKYPRKIIETAEWTTKGLAADVASLREKIDGDFTLILGDEFYYKTKHAGMLKAWQAKKNAKSLIAVWKSDLISNIRKNYSVELKGDQVLKLIEKPKNPPNNLAGLGTYFFTKEFFEYYDKTPPSERSGVVELTDVIDLIARESESVYVKDVEGRYFNINSLADYYTVHYTIRSEEFKKYKISLVVPALNNEATLPDVISDFKPAVHEIIVVDLGSEDQTRELARKNKVKLIETDPVPELGVHNARAIYSAMKEAKGDIVVLATANGTFRERDLPKLLEYLKDCDMAVGTRTTRQMMEQGSNLRPMYRWLNVAFGKLVEIFWWSVEPRFTDIGCIYRAIWKDSLLKIYDELEATDKTYSVEMMIEIMRYHMRCIEVPVSFYQSYGYVAEDSLRLQWRYFFSVWALILSRRIRFLGWLRSKFSK